MPTDRVHRHSQQIPSRLYDRITHRPMGTLPLPAADAATGFIPASAAPVTSHCTRYEALHPIRRGATPTDRVHRHSQQIPSRPHDHVTHRPMGTLPLPAADAATGFIPACATPVTSHYTRSEEVQRPRIGCTASGYKHHRGQFWQNLHTTIEASVIISQPRDVCDSSPQPTQQPASSQQALHPLRGATPVTSHYTRSEEVQCPRIGCSTTPNKYLHGHTIQVNHTRTPATFALKRPPALKRPLTADAIVAR